MEKKPAKAIAKPAAKKAVKAAAKRKLEEVEEPVAELSVDTTEADNSASSSSSSSSSSSEPSAEVAAVTAAATASAAIASKTTVDPTGVEQTPKQEKKFVFTPPATKTPVSTTIPCVRLDTSQLTIASLDISINALTSLAFTICKFIGNSADAAAKFADGMRDRMGPARTQIVSPQDATVVADLSLPIENLVSHDTLTTKTYVAYAELHLKIARELFEVVYMLQSDDAHAKDNAVMQLQLMSKIVPSYFNYHLEELRITLQMNRQTKNPKKTEMKELDWSEGQVYHEQANNLIDNITYQSLDMLSSEGNNNDDFPFLSDVSSGFTTEVV